MLLTVLLLLPSERVMGSMSLQPDMDGEGRELQLEDGLLETLKDKFSTRVKVRLLFHL